MTQITPAHLKKLVGLVESRCAIKVGEDNLKVLQEHLGEVLSRLNYKDVDNYLTALGTTHLVDTPFQALLERIAVGETFFFRDDGQFKALRELVLPDLVRAKRDSKHLSVLSAGCSTGEEPYSLAIMLHRLLPERKSWDLHLIGGDINLGALERAKEASYGEWSFRGVPAHLRDAYFAKMRGRFQLIEDIRRMVRFQYLNLLDGIPYPGLDLILWRNVGIYFSIEMRELIADHCYRALRNGGWLIVGASELSQHCFASFEAVPSGNAILYRKTQKWSAEHSLPSRGKNWGDVPSNVEEPVQLKRLLPPKGSDKWRSAASTLARTRTWGSPPPSEKIVALHYEDADRAYHSGNVAKAQEMLAAIGDGDPRALYLKARILADRGEHAKAGDMCKSYLQAEPDALPGHYLLALIHQAEGNGSLAAEALRKAIFLDHTFVMGHWTLGLVYRELGDNDRSRRHLTHAKKLLERLPADATLEHSEGQTAARMLRSTVQTLQDM